MFIIEMLYIYVKCIIVDDWVVLIGLVNINECFMLGNCDFEVVVIVCDIDMIWFMMVGCFY